MKTKLLFSLTLMLIAILEMLTACSQDEVVTEVATIRGHGPTIEFTLDVASRGTDVVTTEDLPSIYVYGWYNDTDGIPHKCFDTEDGSGIIEFKRQDETAYYSPEKDIYWNTTWGDEVTFYAFNVPVGTTGIYPNSQKETNIITLGSTDENELQMNIKQHIAIQDMRDILTAKTTVKQNDMRFGIPLYFKHALSAIQLQFKNTGSKYRVELYGGVLGFTRTWSEYYYKFVKDGEDVTTVDRTPTKEISVDHAWYNNKSPELSSIPQTIGTEGFAYIAPAFYEPVSYNPYNQPDNDVVNLYCMLRVYDKVSGDLLYPTKDDLKIKGRPLTDFRKKQIEFFAPGGPWNEIAYAAFGLGKSLNLEAGKKYIITVDFANGIGYYPSDDAIAPGKPIIDNKLGAAVSIKEWNLNQEVDVPLNQDDNI